MILLDDICKYKWTIAYGYIDEITDKFITLIEGDKFDFIPAIGNGIHVEDRTYIITDIIYDFDTSRVIIYVSPSKS